MAGFKCTEVLNFNQTEKVVYLLGKVEGQEGEAIAIFTPRLLDSTSLVLDAANITTSFVNDIYGRFHASLNTLYDVQFIFPITPKHLLKYQRKQSRIIRQTAEEYEAKKEALLKKELSHIQWVVNILEGKSEQERVLFRDNQFVIVPDFKCSNLKDVGNLHLMVIFSDPELHSIRELRGEHADLLEAAASQVGVELNKLGVDIGEVRMYFHYPPTFYRLHIHVMHLQLESLSCRVERSHDLWAVIQNLRFKPDYYQCATLNTFVDV